MAPSKASRWPQLLATAATAILLILTALILQEGAAEAQQEEAHSRRSGGRGAASRSAKRRRLVKHMVFYMHDIPAAPNATVALVAAQNGKLTRPNKMGVTFIFDDKLTAGPDPNSMEIGRGQGLYSLASLTSVDLLLVFTAVFHRPAVYDGSTICLQGSDRVFLPEREIGVVGGTGHFRFARGYAILSTIYFNPNGNAIIKFNLTLLLSH